MTAPATFYPIVGSGQADTYWRCDMPAKAIGAKVAALDSKIADRALEAPNSDTAFPWRLTETGAEYPEHEGTALVIRPQISGRTDHMLAMQAGGIRVVAEVDDNYTADPKFNPAMSQEMRGRERQAHIRAMAVADAVIVSTEHLRKRYTEAFRDAKGPRPPIHVVGNHLDPNDFPERSESDRLRVGWMGSQSHLDDVRHIVPALEEANALGCEVVIQGFAGWRKEWLDFPHTHVPWQDPDQREWKMAQIPLDIGLIPLTVNDFTLGKSDLKVLEYGANGVAVVAQNCSVYNRTVKHGETGLLAGGWRDFVLMVRELVKSRRLREGLVEANRQYINEHRLISQHAKEWMDALGAQ